MNKKIMILLAVLLFASTVFAAHCFNLTQPASGITLTVVDNWTGCYVATSGSDYNVFVGQNASVTLNKFGEYQMQCNNGSYFYQYYFAMLKLDNNSIPVKSNTANNLASLAYGLPYCLPNGQDGSIYPGKGDTGEITYAFITSPGKHNLKLMIPLYPKSGYADATSEMRLAKDITFFSGSPSLLVLNKESPSSNFYERNGTYEKKVLFTIVNKSPLPLMLKNYEMNCSPGATCEIDKTYVGWEIKELTGIYLISGTVTVDKSKAPKDINYSLKVDYNVPKFAGTLNIAGCESNFSTTSNPVIQTFGLLDKQDFQVNLISSNSNVPTNCVGEDGMIGQTGPEFVPKINLGFGGITESGQSLIAIDECDAKTPGTLENPGVNNPSAVYCTQVELLVELARKIAKIVTVGDDKNAAPYLSFESYIRTQDFDESRIQTSINEFEQKIKIGQSTGLEDGTNGFGSNISTQAGKLRALFGKVDFINADNLRAGLYRIDIFFKNKIDDYDNTTYDLNDIKDLFEDSTTLNRKIDSIEVTFTPISSPIFNWPFYDLGYTDINSTTVSNIDLSSTQFYKTNYDKRGIILEMTMNGNSLGESSLYKTYAVPLSIKITGKDNNKADTNFKVLLSNPETTNPPLFTSWTGYASTLGSGCQSIISGAAALPYRTPDLFSSINGSNYEFKILSDNVTVAKNQSMYLDTVLFLPKRSSESSEGFTLKVPFKAFTKNAVYDGNSTTPASIRINSALVTANYKIADSTADPTASINSIFEGIKAGTICVNKGNREDGKMQWTAFWNQNAILKTLNCRKKEIVPTANFCNINSTYEVPTQANCDPVTVNGSCGAAAKTYTATETAFSGVLCATGNISISPTFPSIGNTVTWNCNSPNDGTNATCTASRSSPVVVKVDGNCGTANKAYIIGTATFGSDTFCARGERSPSASLVSILFPTVGNTATWDCNGSNGGTNASCSASITFNCTRGDGPIRCIDQNQYRCRSTDTTGQIYQWFNEGPNANCGYTPNAVKEVTFSAGSHSPNTCLIMEQTVNGSNVKCAGNDNYGDLGNGAAGATNYFTPIANLQATSLTSAVITQCALTIDKTVKCWGYNAYGQVGDQTNTQRDSPTPVKDISNVKKVVMRGATYGYEHVCALLENENVYCWGYNQFGQLGNESTDNKNVPTLVSNLSGAKDIVVGGNTNSGYTCAIYGNDRRVKCWGYNGYGQLGIGPAVPGDKGYRTSPVEVPDLNGVSSIYAMNDESGAVCAIKSDGTVYCWGHNNKGQLGRGYTGAAPVSEASNWRPARVKGIGYDGNAGATKLVLTGYGTDQGAVCALLSDKKIKCWGDNTKGRLGTGNNNDQSTPTRVKDISTAKDISGVGYGANGHYCALLENGEVWCWGDNGNGELGNASTTNSNQPVKALLPSAATKVFTGSYVGVGFTCALVGNSPNASLYCWGYNAQGHLGTKNTDSSTTPQPANWS
ncbi:MAG: hypothetical protein WC821_01945 [archaeon]|jgi:alpha-tubulin suppressor-like RCC1 family protein